MAKYQVIDTKSNEVLAEHETRREAQNEIDWVEYCDRINDIYEEDSYKIVRIEIK